MNKVEWPGWGAYTLYRAFDLLRRRINKIRQRACYISLYPRFEYIGKNVLIDDGVYINRPQNISIGDETFIGQNVTLNAFEKISIGRYCAIAAGCCLMTWNHRIDNRTIELKTTGKVARPIKLGDGVWIGYNAIILPGVVLGDGSVIAAGAVVTRDVEDFAIVAGVPAKIIGYRKESEIEWLHPDSKGPA